MDKAEFENLHHSILKDSHRPSSLHKLLNNRILVHLYTNEVERCLQKLIVEDYSQINSKYFRFNSYDKYIYVNLKDSDDDDGKTALYYAITNGLPKCAKLLLENGAELNTPSKSSKKDEMDISLATKLALEMPEVLREVFDRSVEVVEVDGEGQNVKKRQIRLDWRPIVQYRQSVQQIDSEYGPAPKQKETDFLYSLLRDGNQKTRRRLLTHPLVSAFLHLKEEHVKTHLKILYLSMLSFPLIYMAFVYNLYFIECKYNGSNSTQTSANTSFLNDEESQDNYCNISLGLSFCGYCLSAFVLGWAAMKIYMLRFGVNTYYFRSWRTWLSSVALAIIALTLWPSLQYGTSYDMEKYSYQYPIAAIGIFFSWVMFLLQVGNLPIVSIYLEVLARIILSVVRIYILFMPLLIGFYMGFMLMFNFKESFVFRYIIMTTDIGTAEYEDMIKETKDGYFWFNGVGYTFCVCFVVIIVIVFMNFVLGESVNDIQRLKKRADNSRVSKKIENLFVVDMFDRVPSFNCRLITLEELTRNKWYDDYDTFEKPNKKEARKCKPQKIAKNTKIPFKIQNELLKIVAHRKLKLQDGEQSTTERYNQVRHNSVRYNPESYHPVSTSNVSIDSCLMYHQFLQRKLEVFDAKIDKICKKLDTFDEINTKLDALEE